MNELEQLKTDVEELKKFKKSLEMSHSIPLDIDQAFRKRFANLAEDELLYSAVNPNTKQQTLSATPAGTNVPQVFSGFKTTNEGILIPYYTP